jgi:hypothetical protein
VIRPNVCGCVECGREQPARERGWSAYLTTDEDEPAEAVIYCADCAAREFGVPPASSRRCKSATSR